MWLRCQRSKEKPSLGLALQLGARPHKPARLLSVKANERRLSVKTNKRRLSVKTSKRRLSVKTNKRRLSVKTSKRRLSVKTNKRFDRTVNAAN